MEQPNAPPLQPPPPQQQQGPIMALVMALALVLRHVGVLLGLVRFDREEVARGGRGRVYVVDMPRRRDAVSGLHLPPRSQLQMHEETLVERAAPVRVELKTMEFPVDEVQAYLRELMVRALASTTMVGFFMLPKFAMAAMPVHREQEGHDGARHLAPAGPADFSDEAHHIVSVQAVEVSPLMDGTVDSLAASLTRCYMADARPQPGGDSASCPGLPAGLLTWLVRIACHIFSIALVMQGAGVLHRDLTPSAFVASLGEMDGKAVALLVQLRDLGLGLAAEEGAAQHAAGPLGAPGFVSPQRLLDPRVFPAGAPMTDAQIELGVYVMVMLALVLNPKLLSDHPGCVGTGFEGFQADCAAAAANAGGRPRMQCDELTATGQAPLAVLGVQQAAQLLSRQPEPSERLRALLLEVARLRTSQQQQQAPEEEQQLLSRHKLQVRSLLGLLLSFELGPDVGALGEPVEVLVQQLVDRASVAFREDRPGSDVGAELDFGAALHVQADPRNAAAGSAASSSSGSSSGTAALQQLCVQLFMGAAMAHLLGVVLPAARARRPPQTASARAAAKGAAAETAAADARFDILVRAGASESLSAAWELLDAVLDCMGALAAGEAQSLPVRILAGTKAADAKAAANAAAAAAAAYDMLREAEGADNAALRSAIASAPPPMPHAAGTRAAKTGARGTRGGAGACACAAAAGTAAAATAATGSRGTSADPAVAAAAQRALQLASQLSPREVEGTALADAMQAGLALQDTSRTKVLPPLFVARKASLPAAGTTSAVSKAQAAAAQQHAATAAAAATQPRYPTRLQVAKQQRQEPTAAAVAAGAAAASGAASSATAAGAGAGGSRDVAPGGSGQMLAGAELCLLDLKARLPDDAARLELPAGPARGAAGGCVGAVRGAADVADVTDRFLAGVRRRRGAGDEVTNLLQAAMATGVSRLDAGQQDPLRSFMLRRLDVYNEAVSLMLLEGQRLNAWRQQQPTHAAAMQQLRARVEELLPLRTAIELWLRALAPQEE
ncbi:hypothetical protein HXX76_013696 [Chlamydomonas incerta]|uniref:Protein kinase domain-containing protein n=1 Tax=Chlamydomonas incerta TaxID=51695 RepID=A0A835VQI1_CHLIN|nr:hypothetical protein HXX76_013696 [Chlamydomonas incerta]|eukprot:KAG2425487.1 hypothetical protein HXX76_013696 [Chlamydomonas incerta]